MPTKPYDPEAPRTPGRVAFEAYGKARGWRAAAGGRIPPWRDIDLRTRRAWEAAAAAVALAVVDEAITRLAERAVDDDDQADDAAAAAARQWIIDNAHAEALGEPAFPVIGQRPAPPAGYPGAAL
jgi:hypothetical protein